MGNALKRITPGGGTEANKTNDIACIIEKSYGKHFENRTKTPSQTEFYRAVCEIVQEMNKRRSNTQFRVPTEDVLKKAFDEYYPKSVDPPTHVGLYFRMGDQPSENHKVKNKSLTQDEFGKILQQVIKETGFSGVGAKDTLIYIFGVPITALLLKQAVMPNAVRNDFFIPGITSATVLVLAKLNKI